MMKKFAWITFAIALASNTVLAQSAYPSGSLIETLKQQVAAQCATARQTAPEAGPSQTFEGVKSMAMVKMSCECMPAQVDKLAAELSPTTTKEALRQRMQSAATFCTGQLMRSEMQSQCESRPEAALGVKNKKSFCSCFQRKVNEIDDAALIAAASEGLLEFSRAKAAGQTDPKLKVAALDRISESCKQEAR